MPFKGFCYSIFIAFVFLWGCSNPMTSTLLSNYSGCTGSSCTSSGSSLTGDLAILPDPDKTTIASPVDVTDLVEVSGSCQDLNRRNNRILVQVFESEDTASTPYIDNSIDTYSKTVFQLRSFDQQ